MENKKEVLQGQLEIIQGYLNKIEMDNWDREKIIETLWLDRDYLQQEFTLLEAENIINQTQ